MGNEKTEWQVWAIQANAPSAIAPSLIRTVMQRDYSDSQTLVVVAQVVEDLANACYRDIQVRIKNLLKEPMSLLKKLLTETADAAHITVLEDALAKCGTTLLARSKAVLAALAALAAVLDYLGSEGTLQKATSIISDVVTLFQSGNFTMASATALFDKDEPQVQALITQILNAFEMPLPPAAAS